jgi:hypothetical protein
VTFIVGRAVSHESSLARPSPGQGTAALLNVACASGSMTITHHEKISTMTRRQFRISGRRGRAALGVLATAVAFLATHAHAFQGPIPRQLRTNNQPLRATIEAARKRAESGAQASASQPATDSPANGTSATITEVMTGS